MGAVCYACRAGTGEPWAVPGSCAFSSRAEALCLAEWRCAQTGFCCPGLPGLADSTCPSRASGQCNEAGMEAPRGQELVCFAHCCVPKIWNIIWHVIGAQ